MGVTEVKVMVVMEEEAMEVTEVEEEGGNTVKVFLPRPVEKIYGGEAHGRNGNMVYGGGGGGSGYGGGGGGHGGEGHGGHGGGGHGGGGHGGGRNYLGNIF